MNFDLPKEKSITDTDKYQQFLNEFDYNIHFFQQLSELISYNGVIITYISDKNIYELDTSLLDSSVNTLKSIKLCCSIGSFADANTLVRKFRDDSLLYIFVLSIMHKRKAFNEEDLKGTLGEENKLDIDKFTAAFNQIRFNSVLSADEKAVEAWFSNTVTDLPFSIKKKLSFENYMIRFKQDSHISKILLAYNLETYWEKLRIRLNDYVHNNGKQFTNQNLTRSDSNALEIHLKNINIRISYISSFFVVLLLMVDAKLVCSTDLIDYLDSNIEPPEDCQYSIAPFIQEFIDKKVAQLHPELKQYLNDNNNYGMKIE